jgi:hypothetical protein
MAGFGFRQGDDMKQLPEIFIAQEPYPHLKAKDPRFPNGGETILARDYEHSDAEEYVRRANAYERLVKALDWAMPRVNASNLTPQQVAIYQDAMRLLEEAKTKEPA